VVPQVRTPAVVEWDDAIVKCCEVNVDTDVLRLDLLRVKTVASQVRAYMPLHSVQISSPCTDFSTSGRGVEGERAYVTVTATMIALRLEVSTIFTKMCRAC
jgi:hypothetical protein